MNLARVHPLAALAVLCAITAAPLDAAPRLAAEAGAPHEHPHACIVLGLLSGASQLFSTTPEYFTYTQTTDDWSAVGIRPTGADDWDLRLYDNAAVEPTCVADVLSASTAPLGVDIVVGDYNHSPQTQEWVVADRASGAQAGRIEWDNGADQVYVNGPLITRFTSELDVLEIWDLALTAETTYTFEFATSGIDCKLLLFRNPANSPYWTNRASRVLETSVTTTYTAPATDLYAVVVVNETGASGSYSFDVRTCAAPLVLTSGSVVSVSPPLTAFSFTQPSDANYWSAVGVRQPSADWDIAAYGGTGPGPAPNCFTNALANSADIFNTDFVIGDFNVNLRTTYSVEAYPNTSSELPAQLEWDDGTDQVMPNGTLVSRSTGPNDLLEVWDVHMTAGQPYTIEFVPTGIAFLKVLVFENSGSNPYWVPRSSAVLASLATIQYTPARTGWHGIVVVNDNGEAGSYTLRTGTCSTPLALTSGSTVNHLGSVGYFSFTQPVSFWSAVGVRPLAADWDLDVWGTGTGSAWSSCFSNQLANSTGNGSVDFVVGDFNHNSLGTHYVRPYRDAGQFESFVEWDSGADEIEVNAPLIERTTGESDVLEIWDAFLTAGVSYDLYFEHVGLADTKLLVFQNIGATFWAPRSSHVLETTTTYTSFTAPTTDWYGFVVVNDNGKAGRYRLGIATHVSDTGGATPEVTALRRVGPNPTRGGAVEIGFDLREPASVGIQVVDVAGRLVATLPRRDWPPGRWSTSWNGADASGRRVAAGVYYVRTSTAERDIGERKIVVLR